MENRFPILSALLVALLAGPASGESAQSAAPAPAAAPAQQAEQPAAAAEHGGAVQQAVDDRAAAMREKVLADAVAAIARTNEAVAALKAGRTEAALDALATAIGKLELITTAFPELALAPLDVQIVTRDLVASVGDVKAAVTRAQELLDDGRVQDARLLLRDMASEIVIRSVNIPLATYPAAIKAVVPLIKEGRTEEARTALAAALSTLVVVDDVLPLPILRAQALLAEAKSLAGTESRDRKQAARLSELLIKARLQLELAEALGYGDAEAYKPFYETLAEIEKKTRGGGTEQGLFDKLRAAIDALKS